MAHYKEEKCSRIFTLTWYSDVLEIQSRKLKETKKSKEVDDILTNTILNHHTSKAKDNL